MSRQRQAPAVADVCASSREPTTSTRSAWRKEIEYGWVPRDQVPGVERMVGRDRAPARHRHEDRGIESLGDAHEFARRPRPEDACAGDDQRPTCPAEERGDILDVGGVGLRERRPDVDRDLVDRLGQRLHLQVGRHLDVGGPVAAGQHGADRVADRLRQLIGRPGPSLELRHLLEDRRPGRCARGGCPSRGRCSRDRSGRPATTPARNPGRPR